MSGSLRKSLGSPSTTSFMKPEQECPASASATAAAAGRGMQGIVVAILGTEDSCERSARAGAGAGAGVSLRRTLSADMSSKKWLAQNGLITPMKKIASSEELLLPARLDPFSSSEEEEEEQDQEEEDNEEENSKQQQQGPGEFDIWSLIISQKAKEDPQSASSPPYIHPLVKRSASCLSENSLKICTESLGSETGSDGFSSYSCSETGESSDVEKESQEEEEKSQLGQTISGGEDDVAECCRAVKCTYSPVRKSASRSFPPPLPSLSGGGSSTVRMHTRRDNGRLVVEAVSIPSQKNNFAAQRQDGRLVLTFANRGDVDVTADPHPSLEKKVGRDDWDRFEDEEEFEEQFEDFEDENVREIDQEEEDDEEEEDEEEEENIDEDFGVKKIDIVAKGPPRVLSTRLINVHRLALMINKPIGIPNRNPATAWPANKFNEAAQLEGDIADGKEERPITPTAVAQSLPPRPRPAVSRLIPSPPAVAKAPAAASAASFNAYEYFWRRTNSSAINATAGLKKSSNYINKLIVPSKNQTPNDQRQQQLVVLRGNKGEYLVPSSKGCKEPKRTLFWEPYCIATSS